MTKETVFIDADNGGVGVYIGAGNKVGWAKTAKTLKYILDTKKVNVFEDPVMRSLSYWLHFNALIILRRSDTFYLLLFARAYCWPAKYVSQHFNLYVHLLCVFLSA